MMEKKKIECCPHCGSTDGLYTKTTYVSVLYRFGFNNEPHYNAEMFDDAEVRGGETAYCQKCHRAVCRMNTLRKQWGKGVFKL